MTAFIRQEALEKAKEIQLKADEEFAIEKSKLVRQETDSIDTSYEKKFKQASMSQQITRSTVSNKTRLKLLSARQQLLDDLFEQARTKLMDAAKKDEKKYAEVLKGLILEGMYALNEDKVAVRGRKADFDLIKKASGEAEKEYKEKVGKDSKVVLDEKNPLPEDSYVLPRLKSISAEGYRHFMCVNAYNYRRAGGITISGTGGRIDINNTFEERLRLLESDALPNIRLTLFGENQNRKFYD